MKTRLEAPSNLLSNLRCLPSRSLCLLFLLHHLPHCSNGSRRATLSPRFVALGRLFHVCEQSLINKPLAKFRYRWFELLPHAEEFAAGLEEEIFVKQAIVEKCAGLFPVADHHSNVVAILSSHRGEAHRLVECFRLEVLLEPIASLAKLFLATQIVDLQV